MPALLSQWRQFLLAVIACIILVCFVAAPRLAAQDPNNFVIQSFTADYYLDRNDVKQSVLSVIEEITVLFPNTDQNHGIERAIPEEYDGHSVALKVQGVQNKQGQDIPYTTYNSNNNTVLRIGSPSQYVHGQQTYVIRYSQQDVTKNFDGHDEFFWDVNGTDWAQQTNAVTARLHLDPSIAKQYTEQQKCFTGTAGSTASNCTITSSTSGDDGMILQFTANDLGAYENLSMVVGFQSGTFNPYKLTTWEKFLRILFFVWIAVNILAVIIMTIVLIIVWRRYGRSAPGTIVPEYTPPKDISVLTAARIIKRPQPAITAQIIDLAVRHYLKIYQQENKRLWGTKRNYELELVRDPQGLRTEEQEIITIIFGKKAVVGARVALKDLKSKLYRQATALQKRVRTDAVTAGYYTDRAKQRRKYTVLGVIVLIFGVLFLNPGLFIMGIVTLVVASSLWPLTQKGAEQRDYLSGLKEYMTMAETERLKALQSPEGATKVGIDTHDKKQLVKLYERVLPYAILYGIEDQWAKVFAPLYDEPPEWYGGNWSTFNTALFVASLHDFIVSSATAFSSPTSSSSSGFSGGSSGGGGGGGGGGGW